MQEDLSIFPQKLFSPIYVKSTFQMSEMIMGGGIKSIWTQFGGSQIPIPVVLSTSSLCNQLTTMGQCSFSARPSSISLT